MKLARIARNGPDGPVARLAAVLPHEQGVIDLAAAERLRLERRGASRDAALRLATALFPAGMAAAIALGEEFLAAAERAIADAVDEATLAPADVQWLPPLDPPLMRDCMAFEEHARNSYARMGQDIPPQLRELPVYYKGNPFTLIGHEAEVPWPHYTRYMDYELELGFVVGRSGRDLTPEQAHSCLFGVTIFNDFSARDIQGREMRAGLGPAKGKDFATALGPWIVTADELDVRNLTMVARVNGDEWSRGNSATITWSVAELIAYASQGDGIQAGELIGSGTVGLGCGLELGRSLQPGDVVELEVSGIGILRNRLGRPQAAGWQPPPRPD